MGRQGIFQPYLTSSVLYRVSMEWSLGVEYLSGVESNFGVAKIIITPADSVNLIFSNIWNVLF